MAIEIVDFPINSMVIFYSYVKLPEGKLPFSYGFSYGFPIKTSIFLWDLLGSAQQIRNNHSQSACSTRIFSMFPS